MTWLQQLLVIAIVILIAGRFYWTVRVNRVLGKVVMNVMTMPKKFILILGSLAVLLPVNGIASLVPRAAADSPPWLFQQYSAQLLLHAGILAYILVFILFAVLDEQIRENGVKNRGMLTWNQLTGYSVDDGGVTIYTTKKSWYSPRLLQIKWYLEDQRIPKVVKILEEHGLKKQEEQGE